MKSKMLGLLAAGLLAGPMASTVAVAAPVTYEFFADSTYSIPGLNGTFVYDAPDFVSANMLAVTPATCSISAPSGLSCGPAQIYANSTPLNGSDIYDAIGFGVVGSGTYYFYFANGALSAPGSYSTVLFGASQAGRLNVRSGALSVPEPGTLALLGLGLAGLGLSRRRKTR